MRVIDARSGEVLTLGVPVAWGPNEWIRLERVMPGLLKARAVITTKEANRHGILLRRTREVDLQVRWTHPGYFLQHVAFVPS